MNGTAPDAPSDISATAVARWRRVTWPLLAAVAVVAVLAASLAVWQRRLVFNTDEWVETVAPLPKEPEVAEAIGRFAADAVVERLELERNIGERLPEQIAPLSPALTEAIRGRIAAISERLVSSDAFQDVWIGLNRAAHRSAVDIVRSGGIVDASEGEATLNLLPLIAAVLREADERGLPVVPDDGAVPIITADMPAEEARSALGEALGRDLDDDFGEVVVYRGDELSQIQWAVRLVDRLVAALVILAVGLLVAAVVVAPDRRRAVVRLGLAVAVAILAVRATVPSLRRMLLDAVAGGDAPVVETVFERVIGTAFGEFVAVLAMALLAVVIGVMSGPSDGARAARDLAAGRASATGVVGLLGRHADIARVVGLLSVIAWVILGDHHGAVFVFAVILGGAWAVLVGRCERSVEAAAVADADDAAPVSEGVQVSEGVRG